MVSARLLGIVLFLIQLNCGVGSSAVAQDDLKFPIEKIQSSIYLLHFAIRTEGSRCQDGTFESGSTWATGFAVGRGGHILTVRHVLSDFLQDGSLQAEMKQKLCGEAWWLSEDHRMEKEAIDTSSITLPASVDLDAALIKLERRPPQSALDVSLKGGTIDRENRLLGVGYNPPRGNTEIPEPTDFIAVPVTLSSECSLQRTCELFGSMIPGNSGAPILDRTGQVIGITVEQSLDSPGGRAYFLHAAKLKEFLQTNIGELNTCPLSSQEKSKQDVFNFRVLVAHLDGDKQDDTERLVDDLVNQLSSSGFRETAVDLLPSRVDTDAAGRKFLDICHADVLVRGRISYVPAIQYALQFVVSQGNIPVYDEAGRLKPNPRFALTEKLELEAGVASQIVVFLYAPIINAMLSDPSGEHKKLALNEFSKIEKLAANPPKWQEAYLWNWAATIDDQLGYDNRDKDRLEASQSYWSKLLTRKSEEHDENWAELNQKLGNTLYSLGIIYETDLKDKSKAHEEYRKSAEAFADSLRVIQENDKAQDWAAGQFGLGTAKALLFLTEKAHIQLLVESEDAFRKAIGAYAQAAQTATDDSQRQHARESAAKAQRRLGIALFQQTHDVERLERSIVALNEALAYYTDDRSKLEWAQLKAHIGFASRLLADSTGQRVYMTQAVGAYQAALNIFSANKEKRASTEAALGDCYQSWALRVFKQPVFSVKTVWADSDAFSNAISAYTSALSDFNEQKNVTKQNEVTENLAELLYAYGFGLPDVSLQEQGSRLAQQLVERRESIRFLVGTLSTVIVAKFRANDVSGAEPAIEEGLKLARASFSAGANSDGIWSYRKLARSMAANGSLSRALSLYEEALSKTREFSQGDVQNSKWKAEIVSILSSVGYVKMQGGDLVGARAAFEEGLSIGAELSSKDPNNASWAWLVSENLTSIGNVDVVEDKLLQSLERYDRALELARKLTDATDDKVTWDLMWILEKKANALIALQRGKAGLEAMSQRALESEKLASTDSEDTGYRFNVAEGLFRLALAEAVVDSNDPTRATNVFKKFVVLDLLDSRQTLSKRREQIGLMFRFGSNGAQENVQLTKASDILRELHQKNLLDPDQEEWLSTVEGSLTAVSASLSSTPADKSTGTTQPIKRARTKTQKRQVTP